MSPARRLTLLLSVSCAGILFTIGPLRAADPPPGRYTDQLRRECDALLQNATKRPYGWGWTLPAPAENPRLAVVSFEPGQTPAAGLVLLFAGEQLKEARYTDAAVQVARAIAAAQENTGKLPDQPVFGGSASGREPLEFIADRSATRCGLGLLLSVLDQPNGSTKSPSPKRDEELERAARRSAGWLVKQQSPAGGWPVGYPPAAAPRDSTRLVRLDTPDTRDSLFAMLLAYDVLGHPDYRRSVERSVEWLLKLRLGDASKPGAKLWSTAYNLDGTLNQNFQELPWGIDVLASRYSMQALIAPYLSLGVPAAGDALTDASANLVKLPQTEGQWARRYNMTYAVYHPDTNPPGPGDPFYHPTTQPSDDPAAPMGTYGLLPVLAGVRDLKASGREAYRNSLEYCFPYKQHLAATICGMEDDPFASDLPRGPQDVGPYLRRHEAEWRVLDTTPPLDLPSRVHRLWLLLIRAKLEQRAGS